MAIDPATWIRDSMHILENKRLCDITIPGTHDSSTYNWTRTIVPGAKPNLLDLLAERLGTIAESTIRGMEMTQVLNISEQLLAGARYLDIRAAYLNNEWLTYHWHVCDTLENILSNVKNFLDSHECEIVIVEISHFIIVEKNHLPLRDPEVPDYLAKLHELINKYLGDYLFPVSYDLNFTIGDMIKSGRKAIVTMPKLYFDEKNGLWKNKFIKDTYKDKKHTAELVRKNNLSEIKTWAKGEGLLKVSWILTPDWTEALVSLLDLAKIVNQDLVMTYNQKKLKKPDIQFGNILIIDNFGESEIMEIIYKMNGIL